MFRFFIDTRTTRTPVANKTLNASKPGVDFVVVETETEVVTTVTLLATVTGVKKSDRKSSEVHSRGRTGEGRRPAREPQSWAWVRVYPINRRAFGLMPPFEGGEDVSAIVPARVPSAGHGELS